MAEKESSEEPFKLTVEQKANIVENFLVRVKSINRSIQIQRLALSLSDYDDASDDYYAFLHFYSLPENWSTISKDYDEFYVPGYSGTDRSTSLEETDSKAAINGKKT